MICCYAEGGIEWASAWEMSAEDREIIFEVMKKKMKDQNPNAKEYM
jgi:hypothetical protein